MTATVYANDCRRASPQPSIERTCACGKTFTVAQHRIKQGRGTFCSVPCRRASRVGVKPVPASKPARPAPRADQKPIPNIPHQREWPLVGSGTVVCPRCERTRVRGERCACERWTPDGERVA
jgi:hypothetical protein